MNYISLLNTVATLFLLLAVGFISRKAGIVDDTASKNLSELIVKVGQPLMIVSSLISLKFSSENLKRGFTVLALSFGLHMLLAAAAFLLSRPIKNPDERKLSEFASVFTNCAFIGFPIIESLYGPDGLFCGAFYVIGSHLLIWTWGISILARGRDDIKLNPKKIFINFGTIPCAIGILLYLLPWRPPSFIGQFLSYGGSICTPLSMVIIGARLASVPLKKLFFTGKSYYVCAVKLLVMPTLAALVLKALGLDDFYVIFGTVMAALPSASIVTMFGEIYSIDPAYASRLVGLGTLLCTATLPLAVCLGELIASL